MRYLILALSVASLLFTACNKEPDVTPSKENMLRDKRWKLSSSSTMTVKKPDGKDTILKYRDYIDTCYLDDYLSFDSLYFGWLHTGDQHCDVAEPSQRMFKWRLWSNDNNVDLYGGFNWIFAATCSIEPYHFDTLEQSPLRLDTIIGRTDTTPGFIKSFIVLDTIRELRYHNYKIPDFDIYGATVSSLDASTFSIKFSHKGTRLDSTNFHAGAPYNDLPLVVPDTVDYNLIFTAY